MDADQSEEIRHVRFSSVKEDDMLKVIFSLVLLNYITKQHILRMRVMINFPVLNRRKYPKLTSPVLGKMIF